MTQVSTPAPSRAKTIVFAALAVLIPFAAILAIEGVLRVAGVGEERRTPFQPVPGHPTHLAVDPDFGAMFFGEFRPNIGFDPITASKSNDTFRVFALGGSTTAGFPYHWYYGFPARLEDRLAAALPGRRVEVANLGMTATNSYTIWTLAESVVGQRPDAVVIYAGQNEYYGAYGTGGTQGLSGASVGVKRLAIGASKWALVSGIQSFFSDGDPVSERRTMMARVVQDAAIDRQDETFRAGVEQFERNLRDALARFERAGIPVFLATLTSNLADQPPLGDEPEALAAYERGLALLEAGDSTAARSAFLDAKELDGLRFRAPEAMNDAVRRLAAAFPNVRLVDVQQAFRAASPGGVEGAELFADHLHPNARGYALMADIFADAMVEALPALGDGPDGNPAAEVDPVDPVDPVEEGYARLHLAILTNGYPFRKDLTPAEAEAIARQEAASMLRSGHYADSLAARSVIEGTPMVRVLDAAVRHARSDGDTLAALRFYRALLYWQPFNESLIETAVDFALGDPAFDARTAALARYGAIHTESAFSLNALGALALRSGDLPRADAYLKAAEAVDASSPEMLYNRARLLVMMGDTARARQYFERYKSAGAR